MKLYHHPQSRSTRALWMIAELGLPCDVETLDIYAGAGRNPDYQKNVHAHGYVPALEDDGITLIESSAICMYLAERYGDGRFAPPAGTTTRGKYYEWMVYIPATVDPCLETIMFHTHFLPEAKRIPQLVERARKTWAARIEPRYRDAIGDSEFVLGGAFSAADVMVASSLGWARMAGVLSDDAGLTRYLGAMASRPTFGKAHGHAHV